ncbi:methyltransferase domain-containing protein [Micromonospora sp. NPDC005710]|uniref:class I SAM-dependent DNA methyltransferase n=1 Tax=Micromonospora sp. NPDC005710 TaxID=3157051 RepID=UPI0033E38060
METDTVRRAYTSVAALYIELFGTGQQVEADDFDLIGRHLASRSGRVLDLGCGPGHLTGRLREMGVDVVGIDLVPEFIAHARAAHPGVEFQLGSMQRLDTADESIDGILAWYSLIHLPPSELDDVLREFRRVLVPAGRFVLGAFDAEEVGAFDHKVLTAYRWPPDEISARLARAGFREVERLRRPGTEEHRPLVAIAAIAV